MATKDINCYEVFITALEDSNQGTVFTPNDENMLLFAEPIQKFNKQVWAIKNVINDDTYAVLFPPFSVTNKTSEFEGHIPGEVFGPNSEEKLRHFMF